MRSKASGFYADSLEMLLDTMCNVLGGIIFITLTLAVLARHSSTPEAYKKQAAELKNELSAVTSTNAMLEAEIQRVALKLQQSPEGPKTNQVRLPNENRNMKATRPWDVIVRYGRFYPLFTLSTDGRTARVKNTRTIDWHGANVEPKPGQGEEAESSVEAMLLAFQKSSQTNYFLMFYVYEDSFPVFNLAKETAVRLGMHYGWEPEAQDGQPLTFGGAGPGPFPQY